MYSHTYVWSAFIYTVHPWHSSITEGFRKQTLQRRLDAAEQSNMEKPVKQWINGMDILT